jgi:hypothetical protein
MGVGRRTLRYPVGPCLRDTPELAAPKRVAGRPGALLTFAEESSRAFPEVDPVARPKALASQVPTPEAALVILEAAEARPAAQPSPAGTLVIRREALVSRPVPAVAQPSPAEALVVQLEALAFLVPAPEAGLATPEAAEARPAAQVVRPEALAYQLALEEVLVAPAVAEAPSAARPSPKMVRPQEPGILLALLEKARVIPVAALAPQAEAAGGQRKAGTGQPVPLATEAPQSRGWRAVRHCYRGRPHPTVCRVQSAVEL